MDVMDNGNNNVDHIEDYMGWLEVALRAQVVCNMAFFKKFNEIERYVLTKAHGLLNRCAPGDTFHQQFDKLKQLLAAVSEKYDISDDNFLRHYFGTSR